MIRFEFLNNSDSRVVGWLQSRYRRMVEELGPGVMRATVALARCIGTEKLSGQVLNVRSGALRSAVMSGAQCDTADSTLEGRIGAGGVPWYGALQENGGTFTGQRKLKKPPHLLRRQLGERVLTGSPYGIHFPARPFMRPSLQEQRGMIVEELAKAMVKARNG